MEELIKRQNIPSEFILREATAKDIPDIFECLKSLHLYLGILNEVITDETVLIKEGFGKRPLFKSYVAERNGSIVGYTLFSYTYGFDGPEVYMEDLYVSSECRGTGIGTALWASVLKETLKIGGKRCTHIVASDNKSSIGYYKSKGAHDLSQTKNIHFFKQLLN
ncbi:diamine acetyltransferase 1-like [Macrobrachium nipponense]|uniref:diamine acetyltransferase 1-like n=1 Tax=Macrobrachium nipponense TaxID=159736 RepID=UPI0030C81A63